MSKRKIKVKQYLTREGAIESVKSLLAGLESGSIVIGEGADQWQLDVGDAVKVSLKGKLKGQQVKVSLSLSWKGAEELLVEAGSDSVPAVSPEGEPPATRKEGSVPAVKEAAAPPSATSPVVPKSG